MQWIVFVAARSADPFAELDHGIEVEADTEADAVARALADAGPDWEISREWKPTRLEG